MGGPGRVSPVRARHQPGSTNASGPGARRDGHTLHARRPVLERADRAVRRDGAPLPDGARADFEQRFGYDFSRIRIYADGEAATAARAIGARAYTIGSHIAFGAGELAPGTEDGRRLLAHELAHVVQQGAREPSSSPPRLSNPGDAAEREADQLAGAALRGAPLPPMNGGACAATVMRQTPAAATPPPSLVPDAIDYLRTMASFIAAVRAPGRATPTSLNQARVTAYLRQARSVYEAQLATLPQNDPLRVDLRAAYAAVLDEIREAADAALAAAQARGGADLAAERARYAENLAAWIEASPMTSAGLSDTTRFTARDATPAAAHVTSIEAYLDGLLQRLPGLNLSQAQKDDIHQRIQVALRRAFVTVSPDAAGALDLRAIDNPRIVDKYRRVIAMLQAGIASPAQMSLITDRLTLQTPPDPVPDVTAQLASSTQLRRIDLQRVPPAEQPSVRFALAQVDRTTFTAPSTVALRNAYWPLTIPIRSGAAVTAVRYELVFDASSNVRVERLGPDRARSVAPAFAALSIPDKIASLVAEFGLAAIVGRPALPAATPPRPAADWTGPQLDQIKAVYDRLPPADRQALRGITLVRDHVGPGMTGGQTLDGFAHTGPDPAHDDPGPPSSPPPHIHYYDTAFAQNAVSSIGAPGATGPGGDFTIAHEVGHMRIAQAVLTANAAIQSANAAGTAAVNAFNAIVRTTRLPAAQVAAHNAWLAASQAATAAILSFNQGAVAGPPSAATQQALTAARTAVAARDTARAGLATAGVPAALQAAAARLDAARDALLAASLQSSAASDQIPIFVSLANRFGFHKFTDYARREGDGEWFAETFALFIADPDRLNQMNRSLFLWFQAGMPQDRNWTPPA